MDPLWLAVDGVALALPAWALLQMRFQSQWKKVLTAPLFFEGNCGWSLAALVAEFNGEVDVEAALVETLRVKAPLTLKCLQAAVLRLQSNAALRRRFLRELAADASLAGPGPLASQAPLDLMEQLDCAWEKEGFMGLWGATSLRRNQALLPVLALNVEDTGVRSTLVGTLAPSPMDLLWEAGRRAVLNPGPGGWLGVGMDLLGAWGEARQKAQAREAKRQILVRLGHAAMSSMAQDGHTAGVLRRNAHQSGDAYRQMLLAWAARKPPRMGAAASPLFKSLHPLVAQSFLNAEAIAKQRGRAIEALLRGQQGPEAAGALLLAHREVLTRGLALDALPFPTPNEANQ